MSFDWDHARTFLAVAEQGSLSGAARVLGQTQPTVGRQIAALEEALNVTLFERTGRSVALTPFGIDLLDHVRMMAQGAELVALSALGQSQTVDGQVRITASELLSAYVLPPIVGKIADAAPHLEIDIVADNDMRDLVRREADIAIRHARPDQPNLIARRLRDDVMRFYASPAYLDVMGEPNGTSLSAHQIVSYVEADRMLSYLLPTGVELSRRNLRFTSTSQCVALEMARQGLGLIILSDAVASSCEELRPVVEELGPFQVPTWLVAHSEVKTSRRVRFVFDALIDALG